MTTKRGEAAAIVPSEMKGRKHPMTDDEFMWLLERERLAVATAYREDIAGSPFSAGWQLYGFRALGKPEAVRDDE